MPATRRMPWWLPEFRDAAPTRFAKDSERRTRKTRRGGRERLGEEDAKDSERRT